MGEEAKFQEEQAKINNVPVPEVKILFSLKDGLDPRRYNPQRFNEVAAYFTTTADGVIPDPYVSVINKSSKQLKYVNSIDANVKPWVYPLFYVHGSQAWHKNLKITNGRKLTRLNYVRYRLANREGQFNPFLLGRRLSQQYITDSQVKIERDRIEWCKNNQNQLKKESYQGMIDYLSWRAEGSNTQIGTITILPSTFEGSPRNMVQKYQDSMAIAAKFGKPD